MYDEEAGGQILTYNTARRVGCARSLERFLLGSVPGKSGINFKYRARGRDFDGAE